MFKIVANQSVMSENEEENKVECLLNITIPAEAGEVEHDYVNAAALLLTSNTVGYNDSSDHRDYIVLKERIKRLSDEEFTDNEVADILRVIKKLDEEMYLDILNCMVNIVEANDIKNFRIDTHKKSAIIRQCIDEGISVFKRENKVESKNESKVEPPPKFDNPPPAKRPPNTEKKN